MICTDVREDDWEIWSEMNWCSTFIKVRSGQSVLLVARQLTISTRLVAKLRRRPVSRHVPTLLVGMTQEVSLAIEIVHVCARRLTFRYRLIGLSAQVGGSKVSQSGLKNSVIL
jgi:hypothetical protein